MWFMRYARGETDISSDPAFSTLLSYFLVTVANGGLRDFAALDPLYRAGYRARQLYKNISMLFLFPVKMVSLVQASIHKVSYISLQ